MIYYKNNLIHREGSPAIEYINGDKSWYINGLCHRINGPAIEWACGHKIWFKNGKLHRIDGPAIMHKNGFEEWYINGINYTEEEFYKKNSQYCSILLSNTDLNILQTLFSFYHLISPEIKVNEIAQLKEKFVL